METFIEFKEQALKLAKELFFVVPTEDQLEDAYEVYVGQPEEDPTGDWLLWTEHAIRSADVQQMCTVKYNGKKYPIRTIHVKHETMDGEVARTIAPESLIDAIQENEGDAYLDDGTEGNMIDRNIYHYVEDEYFYSSAEEICEKHLDIPMKFVEEEEV